MFSKCVSIIIFLLKYLGDLILRYQLHLFHMMPLSVRRHFLKTALNSPIWLSRLILNTWSKPIGDENGWIHKIEKKTWKGVWIVPYLNSVEQAESAALNSDLVVLYAHGGGYCAGSSTMYMETFKLIINHSRNQHKIRTSILSLEYSLSPEHVWPKARDEAMEAYRYLTDTIGIPSRKIIFAGDSAGANLAAVTLLTIKNQNDRSQPAGAALLSPWVDLSTKEPSFGWDDYLDPAKLAQKVGHFIPNFKNLNEASRLAMMQDPLISPMYGDFSNTCPIFLAYGEKELFSASIEKFKVNLEMNGVPLTTFKRKGVLHIWLVLSMVALSKGHFEMDCKIFINWMASIVARSSKAV